MNKVICIISAVLVTILTGCKTVPTVESIYTTSKSIGVSVGLVANNTKIDDNTRNIVIDISNKVANSIPTYNQTFTESWLPIAIRHCDELSKEGKIDGIQHDLIIAIFTAGVKTLDKFVYEKHPEVGSDIALIESASHGFFDGFLTVFKPANTVFEAEQYEYNEEAYEFMKISMPL